MLKPTPVTLLPHDARWGEQAEREAGCWHEALGDSLLRVHHIGSTSIAGIVAKPILDLMPEFVSLEAMDASRAAIERLGYAWHGEHGLPGRRYCTLSDSTSGRRLVHAHACASGSAEIDRHLAFRDYLRTNRELVRDYEREKLRCRELHPDDSYAYSDAKNAWIQCVQAAAIAWRNRQ